MTLTQLEYVLAVSREGNFRRAAMSCFVTQPTLSAQIHKLEDELKATLFDRSKTPTVPTKVGQRIIEQARAGLREVYRIPEIVRDEQGLIEGKLNVGIIPTISPYLTPLFLEGFCQKYPDVELSLQEAPTSECLRKLELEEIDVAILATQEDPTRYFQSKLYEEELFLFVNPKNPLARKTRVRTSDIHADEIWLLEDGHCLRDEVIEVCKLKRKMSQRPAKIDFRVGNLESLKRIVMDHHGYTLLPRMATMHLSPREKKALKRFVEPHPKRVVYLTKRRKHLKRKLIEVFEEEVRRTGAEN